MIVYAVIDIRSRFFELFSREWDAHTRAAELNERNPMRPDSHGRTERYSVSEMRVQ